jgi:hypothetical protein
MSAHRYTSAAEALKDLDDAYNYWSAKVTETSTAFALGLIAANWAIYGSQGLKTLLLPRLSVFCALLLLLVGLVVAHWLTHEHDKQHEYAEENSERWTAEYEKARANKRNPWPYTSRIECIGEVSRWLKVLLPIIGGLLFIASFV